MKILVDFITDTLAFLPTVIFWRFYIIVVFTIIFPKVVRIDDEAWYANRARGPIASPVDILNNEVGICN